MNEHELAPCNEDTALEAIRELTERAAGAEPRPEQLVNFVKNQRGLKLSYIHAKQAIEHYFGAGRDFIVNTPAPALHGASFDVPAIPAPVTFVPQRPFQAEATEPQIREGKWSKEEHELFLQGYALHGHCHQSKWVKIAAMVRTRTHLQVRSHAQKWLRDREKHERKAAEAAAARAMSAASMATTPGAFAMPSIGQYEAPQTPVTVNVNGNVDVDLDMVEFLSLVRNDSSSQSVPEGLFGGMDVEDEQAIDALVDAVCADDPVSVHTMSAQWPPPQAVPVVVQAVQAVQAMPYVLEAQPLDPNARFSSDMVDVDDMSQVDAELDMLLDDEYLEAEPEPAQFHGAHPWAAIAMA